jgi:menaquinone-dependent protoporphyrinogen oxidase
MDTKILVAYGSKYGATEAIARRIGDVLQQAGLQVEVQDARHVQDLELFRGVVLGSAVYAGSWRKEAADLLTSQEAALAGLPVWLFSSGPTGEGDPLELMKGWRFPEALQPVADRIGARDTAFFGGEIDMQKLSLSEKLLVKGIQAPTGDYRDWQAIEAWARGIAEQLKEM